MSGDPEAIRREKNGHFSNEMKAVVLARISSRSNSAKPPSTVTRAPHHQVGSVCLLLVELVRRYEHRVPAQPKSRPTKDAASATRKGRKLIK